jgi:hypothetical protein
MTDPTRPRRRLLSIALGAVFVLVCGLPYLRWVEHPSLYHDDFMRVESLRNSTLGEALFRPFNEHMAPLFETISYLAWRSSGRRVEGLPTAFLVASFAGFGATIAMLGALIRRETGSTTSAMVAVALFCLSSVSSETVLWYSACSFQWAAAATLLAWYGASRADSPSTTARRAWLIASALASMAAPAFSAIGILAAPLASLRLLGMGSSRVPTLRNLARVAVPAAGLAIYLLICAGFRYREVLGDSLSKNFDLGAALWVSARAPTWVLFPGLVGMPDQSMTIPGSLAALVTVLMLIGSLVGAARSPRRPLILGGVALMVGGYLLVYAARAHPGDHWIVKITRYHLFPQIGLICLVVGGSSGFWRKLDRRPGRGLLAATLFAALLAPLQYRGMRLAAEGPYRVPDQPRLLSAAVRLEEVGKSKAISFDQFFRTLDPVQPRWAPHPWPFHPILFLFTRRAIEGRTIADSAVRDEIIAALSPEDREVIFGGMEATRYRRPVPNPAHATDARLVSRFRVASLGEGRFEALDGPAYLEYQVDPSADDAKALELPGLRADWPVEVWWADAFESWSPDRSVRWKPDAEPSPGDWAVPIDAFPHWRRGSARRLRIVSGGAGSIAVGAPRFLR